MPHLYNDSPSYLWVRFLKLFGKHICSLTNNFNILHNSKEQHFIAYKLLK